MVQVIGAFQRGELNKARFVRGEIQGVYPVCLGKTDFEAGNDLDTAPTLCAVLLADGSYCNLARGHADGRHGHH
jgi:hypothetical protein